MLINPGTQSSKLATLENAQAIADEIAHRLNVKIERLATHDQRDRGYFGFRVNDVVLTIPGDPPDEFFQSRPFLSRRMYVDGSSWLWGYAEPRIIQAGRRSPWTR